MSYNYGRDILGHGHGGGHRGGGRGRRGRGFLPGWGYGGYPYEAYLLEDGDDEIDCDFVGPQGQCLEEVLGMVDMNAIQKNLNGLKKITVSMARIMRETAQTVIGNAILTANAKNLPGSTARKNVYEHLLWHQSALAALTDPNAIYASGDDLKKYAVMAFIEANAVEEGAAYLAAAWSTMWAEIGRAIAALPKQVADQVNAVTPMWLKVGAGVGAGVLVLLGGAYVYRAVK